MFGLRIFFLPLLGLVSPSVALPHSCYLFHPDMPDPCADKACLFGSRCMASPDGHYATCECPTACPNYGDTEESLPVCGSDGKMYKNKCELDRHACQNGRNVSVKYIGKCDPCLDILCSSPQVCHLDEERRPVCRCGEACSLDFNPVCGSDGKTYSSECVMKQEACRTRRDIRIIYRGKCSSGVNPCESLVCRGYEACTIDRFGIAQCACAMACDPIIEPVCGTDGHTYGSECELTSVACLERKDVKVGYRGTCETGNVCANFDCPRGATCSMKDGEPACSCGDCPSEFEPVCGSDAVSHQNLCRLQQASCLANTTIRVMYPGLCNFIRDFNPDDGCEQRQCDFYSVCEPDKGAPGTTKCLCPKNCSLELADSGVVCGTDGVSYNSECDLQTTSCLQQKFNVVATKGHCDLCVGVQCKFGAKCDAGICVCPENCPAAKEPVCASNLITYNNECELQKAACRLGRHLSLHFYGDCSEGRRSGGNMHSVFGGTNSPPHFETQPFFIPSNGADQKLCENIRCEHGAECDLGGDGFPRCSCQLNCSSPDAPSFQRICASDLKIYSSECEMRKEACHRQTELRPRPLELCEEVEVKPCHGEKPLKNVQTGEELFCGVGPHRSNCPLGSFCHRTPSFAKCCNKSDEKSTPGKSRPKPNAPKCSQEKYGCCSDEVTAALGPRQAGCPSMCQCNKLGSVLETCDPASLECVCRLGVGGAKCDRCLPGFWGLQRIAVDGVKGCKACGCSKFGSVREDCEQMTGRCVCKPTVLGHKCDTCVEGEFLGPYGCTSDPINLGQSCDDGNVVCAFGAECEEDENRAGCVCNIQCDGVTSEEKRGEVCASDGFTYESECLVRLQSCRAQKGILVVGKGACPDSGEPGIGRTEIPMRHWTGIDYTEPGDGVEVGLNFGGKKVTSSHGTKSTRHISSHLEGDNQFPTTVTFEMKNYLGDFCAISSKCETAHSTCLNGWCICQEGFYEDTELIQCKPIHPHMIGRESCSKALCDPSSVCLDHHNGSYTCACPLGKGDDGLGCNRRESPVPFLDGKSSIVLGKLAGHHKLSIELEITPFFNHAHGVLLFSSQHANGTGDFLSLALIDGFVEFRYDLGDGTAILKSAVRLHAGTSYEIEAKRYNRDGLLRVNDDEDIKGSSPGTMKSLNLDHGGYLGYVAINSSRVWEAVGTSAGFVGCLHKLKIGRRSIHFVEGKDPLLGSFHGVHQCFLQPPFAKLSTTPMSIQEEGEEEEANETRPASMEADFSVLSLKKSPCLSSPCQHHGDCWVDALHGYKCVCHPYFSGKHCEHESRNPVDLGVTLDFRGWSYLALPKIETGARQVVVELWFLPRSPNGLLLYNGQEAGKGDYVAVVLADGFLSFLFDLGSGMANITWSEPLSLNRWHWVVASREGREGKLQVDGGVPIFRKSPPTLSELNLELPLFIGGIPDENVGQRELGILEPFDGALQYISVNGEHFAREISAGLRERQLERYHGPPCGSTISSPCHNGGSCYPRLDAFICLCPPLFSGEFCQNTTG